MCFELKRFSGHSVCEIYNFLYLNSSEDVFIMFFVDCGGEMAGQEFKRHLLNTLCSNRLLLLF